ncbi:MAG TPA: hypothetical protein VJY39_09620 [Acidisphaera sp.]|nr:hypothetical protein [Acidisphaera sp.]
MQRLLFVTRQSPDWRSLAADFRQSRPIDPARFRPTESIPGFPSNIVDLVGMWNAHMHIDFFTCRSRLKDIADATIARVPGASRIAYDDLGRIGPLGRDSIVFFHDDDDWFSPRLATSAEAVSRCDYDVCVFPLPRIGTDTFTFVRPAQGSRVVVGRRQDFHFRYQTNNYGLNGSICDYATLLAMKDHVIASTYADWRGFRDLYVDEIVSATVKTPCAASSLPDIAFATDGGRGTGVAAAIPRCTDGPAGTSRARLDGGPHRSSGPPVLRMPARQLDPYMPPRLSRVVHRDVVS